jgi:hypothetical protein
MGTLRYNKYSGLAISGDVMVFRAKLPITRDIHEIDSQVKHKGNGLKV